MSWRESFGRWRSVIRRMPPAQQALAAIGVVLAAGCALLLAQDGRPDKAEIEISPPPAVPPLDARPVPQTPFEYDAIVEENVFSPSRDAPRTAWRPPSESQADQPHPERPPAPDVARSFRLKGTVLTGSPATTFAIIEADPSRAGPERYRAGERIGPYRLRTIGPDRVILSDGSTLTLDAERSAGVGGP